MGLYRCLPYLVQSGMGVGKSSSELESERSSVIGARCWLAVGILALNTFLHALPMLNRCPLELTPRCTSPSSRWRSTSAVPVSSQRKTRSAMDVPSSYTLSPTRQMRASSPCANCSRSACRCTNHSACGRARLVFLTWTRASPRRTRSLTLGSSTGTSGSVSVDHGSHIQS